VKATGANLDPHLLSLAMASTTYSILPIGVITPLIAPMVALSAVHTLDYYYRNSMARVSFILRSRPSGSDPASSGPRKIVPKVSFDSRSQCR
jgi:hypothetical protein